MRGFLEKILDIRSFALVAILLCLCSCERMFSGPIKPDSKGDAYDLILVCNDAVWDSSVGDTLISILQRDVEMLNQREPYFKVSRLLPDGFMRLCKEYRNVLIVNVNPSQYDKSELITEYDVHATDQIILTANAPSYSEMNKLLDEKREEILNAYEIAERRRDVTTFEQYGPQILTNLVKDKFGFSMNFPLGFYLANQTEDFIWTRYEMPKAGQGVLVYSYPYTGPEDLSEENIIAKRNKYAALIPGPNDGSYMTTHFAQSETIKIGGREWIRTRGFWELEYGYMGGPFISYTTVDTDNNKVITIDSYVYSPELPKRNFIRELEHIVYTVDL